MPRLVSLDQGKVLHLKKSSRPSLTSLENIAYNNLLVVTSWRGFCDIEGDRLEREIGQNRHNREKEEVLTVICAKFG